MQAKVLAFETALSAMIMIPGYGIIAVPTGIVTSEITRTAQKAVTTDSCPECMTEGHDLDARFCNFCSASLNPSRLPKRLQI